MREFLIAALECGMASPDDADILLSWIYSWESWYSAGRQWRRWALVLGFGAEEGMRRRTL